MQSLGAWQLLGQAKPSVARVGAEGPGGWTADSHKMGEELVGSLHVILWRLDFSGGWWGR